MNWQMYAAVAAIALLMFMLLLRLFRRSRKTARVNYQRRDFLFSPEERFFYNALRDAVGENYAIFGRVPVDELIAPRTGHTRQALPEAWEALAGRCFQFVLCGLPDLAVACAVELREHTLPGRKATDRGDPLKTVCEAAGLPLVRFEAGPVYEEVEIREAIGRAVSKEPIFAAETSMGSGRREPRFSGFDNLDL